MSGRGMDLKGLPVASRARWGSMRSLRGFWSTAAISIALVIAIFAAYAQVTGFSFLILDDPTYVKNNPFVGKGITLEGIRWAFTSTYAANWHPLTWISHMLDVQLFGRNPGMHHLMNVMMHAANTILLFIALRMMTGALWRSAAVAALFALHPLHVESVAWISERKDVLSAFFWLVTMISYSWYARNRNMKRYGLVLFFFLMGILSKPMVVTLPFVLLLLDFWPLGRFQPEPWGKTLAAEHGKAPGISRTGWFCVAEKIPFFVLSGISSYITLIAQHKGHAIINLEQAGLMARVMNVIIAYVAYIEKAFLPVHLSAYYPYYPSYPPILVMLSGLLLVLVTVLAFLKRREAPYFMVGWLWFLGTLVPVIGIVQVGTQAMADRYTYVPMTGIFLCLVWLFADVFGKNRYGKPLLAISFIFLLMVLTLATRNEAAYWKNSEVLFRRAIDVTGNNYLAHYGLGCVLSGKGDINQAVKEYREALKCNPKFIEAYNNLGSALFLKGDEDGAIRCYLAALSLNPHRADIFQNIGAAYYRKGNMRYALIYFRRAVLEEPDNQDAQHDLKAAGNAQAKIEKRISEISEGMAKEPHNVKLHMELGRIYHQQDEYDAAIGQYQKVLSLEPGNIQALDLLTRIYYAKKDYPKAIDTLLEIRRLYPDNPGLSYDLACLFAKENKHEESVRCLEQALDKGFSHPESIRTDPCLVNVRNTVSYRKLMERFSRTGR
jgi:protein O-mannosyl-transferase